MWHQTVFTSLAARLSLTVASAALLILARSASAQDPNEGWTSPGGNTAKAGHRWSLGLEVGKPLILGLEGTYHFDSRVAGSVGFAALSGFTAISGEVDYHVMRFDGQGLSALTGVGFAQYFLSEDGKESQPTMGHALIGIEHVFPASIGVGMNLGYQVSIGSSGDETVDRYGIHSDSDGWFFGMNARYVF